MHIDTQARYFWRLLSRRAHLSSLQLRKKFRSAFTIRTIMTITTGTIAKTTPTADIWSKGIKATARTTTRATDNKPHTGTGATATRIKNHALFR